MPERTRTPAEKGALPRPHSDPIRKPCPLPPGLKSSRVHDAPLPSGEATPAQTQTSRLAKTRKGSGSGGDQEDQDPSQRVPPKALLAVRDPPPRYLGSRSTRGLLHKEVVVEGDARSLEGESTSAILERRKGKRGQKKGRKKGGRSELGQGLAGREGGHQQAGFVAPSPVGLAGKDGPAPIPIPRRL